MKVLVFQFFLELIPDMIPHARPGAVAKLPNAGWRFPEESLEKKQWKPDTNQRNRCKAAQDFEGKSMKGRAVDSNHKHAPHAFDMKMRNSSEPSWGQKCPWRLVINIRHHEFDGKPWVLHPLYRFRYQKSRTWHPHCVWSFKGSSVPRRQQAGRADVEKDGKGYMPRSSYSHHNHNHLVLYANQFFVESVGCIHTHSGADMMIFYEFYVWLYDSCFEWAWSASAEIARPQLWRTGGCTLSRKDTRKRFCR